MSFSFSIRAANKADAKAKCAQEMAKAVAGQACHARDLQQQLAAQHAVIDLLTDDADKDVYVSASGSLAGQWTGTDVHRIEGAHISVSVSQVERKA
jgi:hypothetical protein